MTSKSTNSPLLVHVEGDFGQVEDSRGEKYSICDQVRGMFPCLPCGENERNVNKGERPDSVEDCEQHCCRTGGEAARQ